MAHILVDDSKNRKYDETIEGITLADWSWGYVVVTERVDSWKVCIRMCISFRTQWNVSFVASSSKKIITHMFWVLGIA